MQLLEFLIWNFIFTKRGRVSHSWPVGDFHGEKGDFCDALTSVIMMMMMILNVQASEEHSDEKYRQQGKPGR